MNWKYKIDVVNANNVWCCFEEKLTENTDIEEIVSFAVVSLSQSQIKFFERLKEVQATSKNCFAGDLRSFARKIFTFF